MNSDRDFDSDMEWLFHSDSLIDNDDFDAH